MKRKIDCLLQEWKDQSDRKVLLVRGARQVGKTFSIRTLGRTFTHFLEVNFEEEPLLKAFFENSLNPHEILKKLSAYYRIPISLGETLIFFDEIQACPQALQSLRFFYEKIPTLHVIAAGSLLEFALAEIPSHGVGRISNLFMYPLTFFEFLWVESEDGLLEFIEQSSWKNPLDPVLHKKILEIFKTYLIIGGIPSVVELYRKERDLEKCQILIDDLVTTYKDDFAKYKKNSPVIKLEETFNAVVHQSGSKFKYSRISPHEPSYGYKEAFNLLVKAGLIHPIYHSSCRGIPLGAQKDPQKFKAILFDIGIHQRVSGLNLSEYLLVDPPSLINRGVLAEIFVGLELLANAPSHNKPELYYWHREAKSSNSEVDYVIQKNEEIIPIEVKSGMSGRMQSMHLFLTERNLTKGIRLSQENFNKYDSLFTIPIYACARLFEKLFP